MSRTTVVVLAAVVLSLTACSGPGRGTPARPSPTATHASTRQVAACTDRMVTGRHGGIGAPECARLPQADYLKALRSANQRGQEALQRREGGVSRSAQP
ncbi:hypothetical protein [Streptomyces sp. NPDC093261]|uniref:hypothetical protein n=1 Tax=Streptomyces sp. NPDC093261 TaxID=3366037 RepID=UPI0037F9BE8C